MAQITLENLHKTYDSGVRVVVDVNLSVADGEMVVLVGPSGCGKSTTLRMIAGLEDVSSGTVSIGQRVVNDLPPKDRDLAMVFQSYALYPHMTVFDNIAFGLRLRKVPAADIEAKVRRVADILAIGQLLERLPGQLSGGQRQRVAVGRAIARNPQCFLFDEPLSNLDARLRVDMRAEIRELHQRLGSTSVYVTHDQEEAMTLGDRVVVMKDGVVQQVGTPLDIYHLPRNRFVAGFLGSPPMNFLAGHLAHVGDTLVFREGSTDRGNGLTLPVVGAARARLAALTSPSVVLGLRPEAFSRPSDARAVQAHAPLNVRVDLVQPLGDRNTIVFRTPLGERMTAQLDAYASVVPGQTLDLALDLERLHFFAPGPLGQRL